MCKVMRLCVFALWVLLLASCVSSRPGTEGARAEQPSQIDLSKITAEDIAKAARASAAEKEEALQSAGEVEFDSQNPPAAVYIAVKIDIQDYIRKLDGIIRAKNYTEWVKQLSRDYYEHVSSAAFLRSVSQQPRLKSQNIELGSLRDYFTNVVVPSRANDRADDIEFVTLTRVKVYTVNDKGQRLRLYTLDKTAESWEIVN